MRRAIKAPVKTLSKDPNTTIRTLITLSKKLSSFADQEMQALAMGDMLRFAYIQKDKDQAAQDYAASSLEFRNRLEEFRGADKTLLDQLDKLQVELKKKSENNNSLIRQIRDRAAANTKATLFTVQELGQRVILPNKTPYEAQKGA